MSFLPLVRFHEFCSFSSGTAADKERKQVVIVEIGEILNRFVQLAEGHVIGRLDYSLKGVLKICAPYTFDR